MYNVMKNRKWRNIFSANKCQTFASNLFLKFRKHKIQQETVAKNSWHFIIWRKLYLFRRQRWIGFPFLSGNILCLHIAMTTTSLSVRIRFVVCVTCELRATNSAVIDDSQRRRTNGTSTFFRQNQAKQYFFFWYFILSLSLFFDSLLFSWKPTLQRITFLLNIWNHCELLILPFYVTYAYNIW